jgi:hypothetical protein
MVKFAIEYLEHAFKKGEQPTLVGMCGYADWRDHLLIELAEVNEALSRCPDLAVQRKEDQIIFVHATSGNRKVTEDEFKEALTQYHKLMSKC